MRPSNRFSVLTAEASDTEDLRIEMESLQIPGLKTEQAEVSGNIQCQFREFSQYKLLVDPATGRRGGRRNPYIVGSVAGRQCST